MKEDKLDYLTKREMITKTTIISNNDIEDFDKFWDSLKQPNINRPYHKPIREILNRKIEYFFEENIAYGDISEKLGNSICEFLKRNLIIYDE